MTRVGLAKGDRSYDAVRRALDLVREDVRIPRDLPVLIKPNLVSPTTELSATPVDAVRATMDFLKELGVRKFTVGEASAESGDTMAAFERFGYLPLADRYDVQFRDLNQDEPVVFEALDANLRPVTLRLARSYFDSYLVSVARMKTHDSVVVTLTIKNTAVGSILNANRHALAHGARALNLTLARLNLAACPRLAVIDGVVGMEGDGPVDGTSVSSGVALAGTDPVAVDLVGTEVMGMDSRTVGYLWYLCHLKGLSREQVEVLGENPSTCVTPYQGHGTMSRQLAWWVEGWKDHLDGDYVRSRGRASQR